MTPTGEAARALIPDLASLGLPTERRRLQGLVDTLTHDPASKLAFGVDHGG